MRAPRLAAAVEWAGQIQVRATTGVPRVAGLLTVSAALLSGTLIGTSAMSSGWTDPLNGALTALLFLAPVAVGVAVAEGRAIVLEGLIVSVLTATRGRRRALLASWAALASWQIAALAALLLVITIRADPSGVPSWSTMLLPASELSILLCVTTAGLLLGRHRPWRWLAPAAAVTVFLLLFGLSVTTGPIATFAVVFTSTFYQPWFEPSVRLLTGQLALTAGVLSMAMIGLLTPPRTGRALVLAALVTASSSVLLLNTSPSPVQIRAGGPGLCAEQRGVQLCVWPASQAALAPGLASLARYVEAASPFLPVPTYYRQPGLDQPLATDVEIPGDVVTEEQANLYTSIGVLQQYSCDRGLGLAASGDLYTWMVARVDPTFADTTSAGYRMATATTAVQQDWVNGRVRLIRACPV